MADKNVSVAAKYKKRSQAGEIWHRMRKNKGAMLGLVIVALLVFVALFADVFLDYETDVIGQNIAQRLQHPSAQHIMGTDDVGRDVFARLLYGARFSLAVGVAAVAFALVVGVLFGSVAGFFGGRIEEVIMRISDMLAAVPSILMAIAIVSAIGQSTLNLMIAVGVTSVPQFIRITRAAVMTVRNQEYIEAAQSIGLSKFEIIWSHVLPNCLSPIIVQTTLRVASAIISASSLSFLGLGVPSPDPEWGSMLSTGRKFIRGYSYLTVFPGLAIMITVLALNLLGDGLRDAMDPKLKR